MRRTLWRSVESLGRYRTAGTCRNGLAAFQKADMSSAQTINNTPRAERTSGRCAPIHPMCSAYQIIKPPSACSSAHDLVVWQIGPCDRSIRSCPFHISMSSPLGIRAGSRDFSPFVISAPSRFLAPTRFDLGRPAPRDFVHQDALDVPAISIVEQTARMGWYSFPTIPASSARRVGRVPQLSTSALRLAG